MNLAEACSSSEINSLVRRGLLWIPSVKCPTNQFIHVPTPPSATVSHSIRTEADRGRDSSFAKVGLSAQTPPPPKNRWRWMLCFVCFGDGELGGRKLMAKWSSRREEELNGTERPPHDAFWACVRLVASRVLMAFWWAAPLSLRPPWRWAGWRGTSAAKKNINPVEMKPWNQRATLRKGRRLHFCLVADVRLRGTWLYLFVCTGCQNKL